MTDQASSTLNYPQGQNNPKGFVTPNTLVIPQDSGTTSAAGAYGSGASGAFGSTIVDPATGISQNAAGTIPLKVKGQVIPTTIANMVAKLSDPTLLGQIRKQLISAGVITKGTKDPTAIKNKYISILLGSSQTQMDPNDYLAKLKASGFGQDTAASTGDMAYVKTYTGSTGDALFRKSFQDVFDRLPTAADYASPIVDKNGKTISWVDALNAEAQKKENHTTVKRSADGTLTTTNDPFDAATWLTNQLMTNYTKGIEAGTAAAPQKLVDKYAQLAQEYGIPVYDSTTKKLYMNAAKDIAAIEAGTKTLEDVASLWKGNVKAQYSHLTPAVDSGLSLRQIADPGIKLVAKLTGKNENLVDLNDPYVQAYLKGDGKSTLADNVLRSKIVSDSNSGFDKTPDAYALTDNLLIDIKKRFGRMA
jgi:hypothetical protein